MRIPPIHWPTVVGRLRSDWALLLLVGVVVALTSALTSAVAPVTERTADRAVAAAVDGAGTRGDVVAMLPEWYDDPGNKERVPDTVAQVRRGAAEAQAAVPPDLAAALQPGITSISSSPFQLRDAGPGRYLQLVFLDTGDDGPAVSYTSGQAPDLVRLPAGPAPGAELARLPAVQVAVSDAAAELLGLEAGDRVPARDEQGRSIEVRISGVFTAADTDDRVWQVEPQLLHPVTGRSEGVTRSAATALVSATSLPDLRLALPGDALTHRVVFQPDSSRVTWRGAESLQQSIVALQSGVGLADGGITWDSLLGAVVQDGRTQVASAQGQAQVLVIGLLVVALLVLVLAAQLLVRRRAGALSLARERGATLPGLAGELAIESLLVAVLGTAVGLLATRLLAGSIGWGWSAVVLVAATTIAPVLGAAAAREATAARRVPANRSARRTAVRAALARRLALELAVLAVAALAFTALRQRGVGRTGVGGDPTAASAVTWAAVVGALLLLRVLPPMLRLVLRMARRSASGVAFFVAARLVQTGARALPVLIACIAVAQLTFGVALASTVRDSQSAGALSFVGADARLSVQPDPVLARVASDVAEAPGVRAVAAGRVEDGVQVSAQGDTDVVRLVVVDAIAFEALLATSDLADAPQLARLQTDQAAGTAVEVPALVLGGTDGLRDDPRLRWEDTSVALDVVGTAPDVDASVDPVVVVDASALATAGVVATPDTVWAVGPGAATALEAKADELALGDVVLTYADELDRRRSAALPSAMVDLATASGALLLVLALLGTLLAAAADAPARETSLARLRALGLADRDLRRVLAGELVTPVAVSGLAGLGLGVALAHLALGSLSIERLTGAPTGPDAGVPWWVVLSVVALVVCTVVATGLEWRRARRTTLAELLRS